MSSVPADDRTAALNPASTVRSAVTSSFTMQVVDGSDSGKVFVVDGQKPVRLYVGTSDASDFRLDDPHVSRRHCGIELRGDMLELVDSGSTNGTIVNGVRVREASLGGGELIRVGGTTLRLAKGPGLGEIEIAGGTRFGRVIGMSPEMRKLYPYLERLAKSDIPIIIEGETGTGKELLAESIHEMSGRSAGPLVVFDCTAVPPSLMESALFGHERGAFTGAISARPGVFEQADGGTLFIDEIGDLDSNLQPKLLRALEKSEVQRVGSNKWIRANVRILVATRRDLEQEIQQGRFRDDLYYRLAVARIELPPLRRRSGDIHFIANHIWRELGGDPAHFPGDLLDRTRDYSWPGNIRELRNAVAHRYALGDMAEPKTLQRAAATTAGGDVVAKAESGGARSDIIEQVIRTQLSFFEARERVLAAFQERFVDAVLDRHGGNVAQAAAASGIARRYLYVLKKGRP